MNAKSKTITVSGRIREPEAIEEHQQTCRDLFGITSAGSLEVSADRSGSAGKLKGVRADDVLDITLEEGIRLFVRRDDFETDFPSAAARSGQADELEIRSLGFGPPSRGLHELLVKVVSLFNTPLSEKAGVEICEKFENSSLNPMPGLYGIGPGESLRLAAPSFPGKAGADPLLVFLHGTASHTEGSFGGLWEERNAGLREALFSAYPNRIYALQHRTLTESPIRNAIDLVEALPDRSVLHLVSHSRGGLVGELVCRGSVPENEEPFLREELEVYRKQADAAVERLGSGKQAARKAYEEHLALLERLGKLLQRKQIRVERFIRVACPARGTTLASGRLDRWLSVVFNVIGLIPALRVSPYFSLLENFIRALVKTRTKPHQLPGLEAQMPTSPTIGLLNAGGRSLSSDLTVISGDIEHDGLLGRIALLLPDHFYDTDHDLVVNTPSMYGGSDREHVPGKRGERFYFDQGAGVSHFNYFQNAETASRVLKGLTLKVDELGPWFEPRLPEPDAPIPSRARTRTGPQPIVFVLPGIMGSELDHERDTVWASKFRLALGGMRRLEITDSDVASSGLIPGSYRALVQYLAQANDVYPFHYDWRGLVDPDRGVDEVRRLADAVREKVEQASRQNQPVSIVAHSMGGLLARLMIARHRDVWEAMLGHPDSRLVMLGTPNGGSFSIPRLLFGQDRLVRGLALIDIRHSLKELLDIIRRYPGVMLLLPYGDDQFDFFSDETWRTLSGLAGSHLAVPDPATLAAARELREELNARPVGLEEKGRVLYVAGRAAETPVALQVTGGEVRFRGTAEGDGRVPWATGIPTGVPAWYMDAVHGDLVSHQPGFEAIADLLRTGRTSRLPDRPPDRARGVPRHFGLAPDAVELYPDERELQAWAMGASVPRPARRQRTGRIRLRITHGNLAYSRHAVMVGHYAGDGLFSAERYLDRCLDGRLAQCLDLGLYPGPIETAELVMNRPFAKPAGALIVGLGDVGKLTLPRLARTVRKAVQRYAFDLRKCEPEVPADGASEGTIALSSLLVGASSGGLPLSDALLAILRGVSEANQRLSDRKTGLSLTIGELQLLELWEDRAILASRATAELLRVDAELSDVYEYDGGLEQVKGGQSRAFAAEEAGWWSRLQIEEQDGETLSFNRITNTARTEKRLLPTERDKVDLFLSQATSSAWTNRALPRTLFEMLVPNELKESSDDLGDTILIVDEQTARYPWELMEDRLSHSGTPLAVQSRLIRQLASTEFRRDPRMSPGNRALVIGEPRTESGFWPPLPGAVEESRLVAGLLSGQGRHTVTHLVNPEARDVLKTLHAESYRVLHLAGHGVHEFDLRDALRQASMDIQESLPKGPVSGMVIGDHLFLNANDVRQMRRVPELVFINCCYLGRTDSAKPRADSVRRRADLGGLAANLATQFIRMGARAVVAAGWEVDDAAAKTFADVFYRSMMQGRNFSKSVHDARRAVFGGHRGVNTWGAYQCYGNPDYSLEVREAARKRTFDRPRTPRDLITRLNNLCGLAATDSDSGRKWRMAELDACLDPAHLPEIEQWEQRGEVSAAVGQALGEFDRFEEAVAWYRKAAASGQSTASIEDFEQFANLLVRQATAEAVAGNESDRYRKAEDVIRLALDTLDRIDSALGKVRGLEPSTTVERECLRASAHKRSALVRVLTGAGRKAVESALKSMRHHYREADELHLGMTGEHDYYPFTGSVQADIVLRLLNGRYRGMRPEDRVILRSLAKASDDLDREDPGFWNLVSRVDCQLTERLGDGSLPEHWEAIADQYLAVRKRAATPREFRSVTETLEFLIHLIDPRLGPKTSRSRRQDLRQALEQLRDKLS